MTRFVVAIVLMFLCENSRAAEIQHEHHHGIPLYGTQADNPRPRFTGEDDETVIVGPGMVVSVDSPQSALDVLVRGGTLAIASELRCRNLSVVEGTILYADGADVVVRDIPIDLTIDPKQWGHGVLCLGMGQMIAATDNWRAGMATLTECIHAGDTSLKFAAPPHGWQTGDVLVLPDTRQPTSGDELSAHTETVTIAAVDADGTVTLTAPVQYQHPCAHGIMPDVGCLSQPITIRSENKDGTRGHIATVHRGATFLEGVAVVDMGRTTTAPLGPENPIGRYATHWHHVIGRENEKRPWQGELKHCSIWGSPKWGVSIHNSHWINVEGNCFYDCAGGSIVTEHVRSYGFRIADNFSCGKSRGSGLRITSDHGGRAFRNDPGGDFWHDSVFLGLGSAMGEITGNHGYCHKEGVGMAGFGTDIFRRPTARGIELSYASSSDTTEILASHMGYNGVDPKRYPFLFPTTGNQVWGGWRGIETWSAHNYPDWDDDDFFTGLTLVNCRNPVEIFDHQETVLDSWRVLGDASVLAPDAVDFKDDYRFGITAVDCELRGYESAYRYVNDSDVTLFKRCVIDCPVVMYCETGPDTRIGTQEREVIWEDCEFIGNPEFLKHRNWNQHGTRFTKNRRDGGNESSTKTLRTFIRPWTDGNDYQAFYPMQLRDFALPEIAPTERWDDWPDGIYTHSDLIAAGRTIYGNVVPEGAFQRDDFGSVLWVFPEDCCSQVERLKARIKELEGN